MPFSPLDARPATGLSRPHAKRVIRKRVAAAILGDDDLAVADDPVQGSFDGHQRSVPSSRRNRPLPTRRHGAAQALVGDGKRKGMAHCIRVAHMLTASRRSFTAVRLDQLEPLIQLRPVFWATAGCRQRVVMASLSGCLSR